MAPHASAPAAPAGTSPSPVQIFQTLNGTTHSAILRTAIELDVFTRVGQGEDTAAALASSTQCSERGVRMLCDSLTALGLLTKESGHYQLTRDTAVFLDRNSPAYLGTCVEFLFSPLMLEGLSRMTEAVRKGGTAIADHPSMQPDSASWVNFARNMAPLQRFPAQAMAKLLVPKPAGPCKVLDIAAGHGLFGISMAEQHPQAEIYALDWPQVLTVAQENAAAAGVANRFHTIPGNAFEVDFGSGYDWILLPNFLHHFDPPTCEAVLRKVRAALGPEGEAAILEFVTDDDKVSPPPAALFSIVMLTTTPAGDAYSYAELDAMCRNAGFSETELHPLPPAFQRVVIATP